MKTVSLTDFRKKTSGFIAEVEHGETIILLRHGKPVAEIIPFSGRLQIAPAWKKPGIRLKLQGSDLSRHFGGTRGKRNYWLIHRHLQKDMPRSMAVKRLKLFFNVLRS